MTRASSDRRRIQEFKRLLTGRLLEIMDPANDTDGPVAIAALGELTAELSYTMVGKQLTLALLNELAIQVHARDCIAIRPPANGNSKS